jgi:TatA/E family protein of Tat protein translocase
MGNFGATEIILILLVVVLLFGGRKIPELMKGIGQGMKIIGLPDCLWFLSVKILVLLCTWMSG